jgi:hypothetical protein
MLHKELLLPKPILDKESTPLEPMQDKDSIQELTLEFMPDKEPPLGPNLDKMSELMFMEKATLGMFTDLDITMEKGMYITNMDNKTFRVKARLLLRRSMSNQLLSLTKSRLSSRASMRVEL